MDINELQCEVQSAYDARARLKLANPFRKIDRAAKVFG
jgi:hypothetical protein